MKFITEHRDVTYSIWWNLLVITLGSVIYSVAVKAIAVHHEFITGGLFGTALLAYYAADLLSPGLIYFILSIPLFFVGWFFVSKRFFWYSLYSSIITTLAYEVLQLNFHIHNQLYAAIACGVLAGAGAGIVLRSLGSMGGLDIVAIMLNQRWNLGIGKFYFYYNLVLFGFSFARLEVDLVIASLILVFVSSAMVEYFLALFNQRKLVFIISDKSEEIAREVLDKTRIGATWLKGAGAYTGKERNVLMTVTNNMLLKRLEQVVFTIDPYALFIVENTFNVIGASFSKRKVY